MEKALYRVATRGRGVSAPGGRTSTTTPPSLGKFYFGNLNFKYILTFMQLLTRLLSFVTLLSAVPLSAQQRAPQFQSLTPGPRRASPAWVGQVNAMKEAERMRRVRTHGVPPAPANRRSAARPAPSRRQTPPPPKASRTRPQRQPNRPPSTLLSHDRLSTSRYQRSRAKSDKAPPGRGPAHVGTTPAKRQTPARSQRPTRAAAARPSQRPALSTKVRSRPSNKRQSRTPQTRQFQRQPLQPRSNKTRPPVRPPETRTLPPRPPKTRPLQPRHPETRTLPPRPPKTRPLQPRHPETRTLSSRTRHQGKPTLTKPKAQRKAKTPGRTPSATPKIIPVLWNPGKESGQWRTKPIAVQRETTRRPKLDPVRSQSSSRSAKPGSPRQLSSSVRSQSSSRSAKPGSPPRFGSRSSVPSKPRGRSANPYAPYRSRGAYERAVARTAWRTLGPAAQRLRRGLASKPPATRARYSKKVPNSRYVTAGLPQGNPSGSVIETTLFGL